MPHQTEIAGEGARSGKLVALFPLALVFAAITFLALGAKTKSNEPAVASVAQVATNTDVGASDEARTAEEAAAAAVVAISLARVSPALPEEALEPPKAKPQPVATEAQKKPPAPRRDANAQPPTQRATSQAPAQTAAAPERNDEPAAKPKPDSGILARIGSYAPSPSKIAGAVSDGVSKLASYIPGL